jgi:hypothetical protein
MCTDTLQGLRTVTCEDGLACKRREDARLLGDHFLQVFNERGAQRRPHTVFPNLPGPTLQRNATFEESICGTTVEPNTSFQSLPPNHLTLRRNSRCESCPKGFLGWGVKPGGRSPQLASKTRAILNGFLEWETSLGVPRCSSGRA